MGMRHFWLGLAILSLSCHSLAIWAPPGNPDEAERLWDQGQAAMKRGEPDEAIAFYERSLFADPKLLRNHLSLASAYLEKGDDAASCEHLTKYVAAHPEHAVMRAHLAELLLRLHRSAEARAEFERFIADVQDDQPLAARHLVHCHSRLMEIAEEDQDEYAEHLHRGIGLYLLACRRADVADPDGELCPESLLCKAAGELNLACLERPEEARPSWYLYGVWSKLGQQQPALRCLRAADDAGPFTYLTPTEKRDLRLACHCRELARPAK